MPAPRRPVLCGHGSIIDVTVHAFAVALKQPALIRSLEKVLEVIVLGESIRQLVEHLFRVGVLHEVTGRTCRNLAAPDHCLNRFRQPQQAERVFDSAVAFQAEQPTRLGSIDPALDHRLQQLAALDRVQVLAFGVAEHHLSQGLDFAALDRLDPHVATKYSARSRAAVSA